MSRVRLLASRTLFAAVADDQRESKQVRSRTLRCRASKDYQAHYMDARAGEMSKVLATPPAWRPKLELDRLLRAIELRELVNARHDMVGEPKLRTRTPRSLRDGIHEKLEVQAGDRRGVIIVKRSAADVGRRGPAGRSSVF